MGHTDELFLAAVGDATRSSKLEGITCSCGRTSYLAIDSERRRSEVTGNWKFRTPAEAGEYKHASGRYIKCGWYCGKPDHESV
jgi:hypothetical protein